MAINHGKYNMLNGSHGGPTRAESEVPLFFSMPGPDLIISTGKTQPDFVHGGASLVSPKGLYFRNWQMSEFLTNMMSEAMNR